MHPDLLGWFAAALMVATFSCRDARRLRPLAVATNLAFIGYGGAAGLAPVLALHALLLPINLWRWAQALDRPVPRWRLPVQWPARTGALLALLVVPTLVGCGGDDTDPPPSGIGNVGPARGAHAGDIATARRVA